MAEACMRLSSCVRVFCQWLHDPAVGSASVLDAVMAARSTYVRTTVTVRVIRSDDDTDDGVSVPRRLNFPVDRSRIGTG